jgi:Pvc16 N-terminal domain/IPT/TIG domain
MSNFFAIATVTATLQRELQAAANAAVNGANVTAIRPDGAAGGTPQKGVNIFLYQVTPNSARRNADLPNRSSDGDIVQRPRVALDLHYLLSFYGNELELEPQRLLGSVAQRLHSGPILTGKMIEDMLLNTTTFGFLAGSNLADEKEPVRFTPLGLSLEELSKLWSVFFQTPYALSVAYQASVVLIEGTEQPRAALPVRERTITVLPFRAPEITEILSALGSGLPVLPESTLVIRGRNLRGDVTRVVIGGNELTPQAQDLSDNEIKIVLPPNLRAGINSVQVVQKLMLGAPPAEHSGFESNVAAFVLSPTINSIDTTVPGSITIELDPTLGASQRVVLLLNKNAPAGTNYTFPAELPPGNPPDVKFPLLVSPIESGPYFARVQVDGAESSLLDLDPMSPTFKQLIPPQVTIP